MNSTAYHYFHHETRIKMMMRSKTYELRNQGTKDHLLKLIKSACYAEDGNFFRQT